MTIKFRKFYRVRDLEHMKHFLVLKKQTHVSSWSRSTCKAPHFALRYLSIEPYQRYHQLREYGK